MAQGYVPKELKEVKVGRFPTVSQLEEWKYELITNVLLTSCRPDNTPVAWIREVDAMWADEEFLRESGDGWYQLDQKLAGTLLLILPPALKRKVKTAQKKEMNTHNRPLNGRQILYKIYQFLRTNSTCANYFNIEDLQRLQYPGDDPEKVDLFLTNWIETTEGMRSTIDDKELGELLFKRIRDSKALSHAVQQYKSAGHRTPFEEEHTHSFLLETMEHYVSDYREDKNRTQRSQAHEARAKDYSAAPAVTPKKPKGGAPVDSAMPAMLEAAWALTAAAKGLAGARVPAAPAISNDAAQASLKIQVYSAYAVGMKSLVYRDVSLKNVKGGKFCIAHMTNGCTAGSACPLQHTKNQHVCIQHQTTEGCKRKACTFSHEDIGKTAAIALLNWAQQKSKQGGGEKKPKGKGKGADGPSAAAQPREKLAPRSRLDQKCRQWFSTVKPKSCTYGDECAFSHVE
jgi:hypothetical protein